MNDAEFKKAGFLPVACIMHAGKTHGAIGRAIVKKPRKGCGPQYYVAALFKIKGKLAYGQPVEITAEQAAESQKIAFLVATIRPFLHIEFKPGCESGKG